MDARVLGMGRRRLLLGTRHLGCAASRGVLWTPGYWGFVGGVYLFHPGYWGRTLASTAA